MMWSAGTQRDSFPPLRPFSHHSLGSRPTKQLASMGIPALLSCRPLSPFSISLPLSLFAAGPRREAAKFIFSMVVPLRWRRGPCHAAADVLGEGPWRDVCGTLLLLQHSILLFLLKGNLVQSFLHGQSEVEEWVRSKSATSLLLVTVVPMNKAKLAQ